MQCISGLAQLLVLQYLTLGFALVTSLQFLDLNSGFLVFGPGWTPGDGQSSTTNGTVYVSFRGSVFYLLGPTNPSATLTLYVDGQSRGTHPDGHFVKLDVGEGNHQVMINAQAPESQPYAFRGIIVDSSNTSTTYSHTPEIYGLSASVVTPNAMILDNTDPCIQYSSGWDESDNELDKWAAHNGTLAMSSGASASMTIYFLGTAIWIFSSQKALRYPNSASISSTMDSGNPDSVSLSSFTANDVALNQKLLLNYTGLTDTLHVMKLSFDSAWDGLTFDFARVEGGPIDCTLFITQLSSSRNGPVLPLSLDLMEILLIVSASALFPLFLVVCVSCSRWKESRAARRQQPRVPIRPSRRLAVTTDDSSSFMSIFTGNRETSTHPLPLVAITEDRPRAMHFPRVMVTPFGPVVLGEEDQRYREQTLARRNKRAMMDQQYTSSSGAGEVVSPDTISEVIDTTATGSDVPSTSRPQTPAGDLTQRNSITSISPPPSYVTDSRGRPFGRPPRLLTREDLGRLVDRVTALRGRDTLPTIESDPGSPALDEEGEEDHVEILARQIVESSSSSQRTRVRTEKNTE
ncbi:hypothetical protein M408DRAFT_24717 [Serendipita vermifera MAFF 305830]|uniref:Transmembrane protein n=1 Tax=Serendipita vermifera MAFF 305830 TaxID=933852 RepID=A0A0C2XDS8_SERVB|nr:hypothetical protein M408DRAFT_24717 [Serendipita vermifera MAFF 305830]